MTSKEIYTNRETRNLLNIIRIFSEFNKISSLPTELIINQHSDVVRNSLRRSDLTVLICARNEQEDLPKLLYALSKSSLPVNALVVDNGSQDDTAQIASNLGATVITEKKPGLIYALQTGFDYVFGELKSKKVLLTDSDCIPTSRWSKIMNNYLELGRIKRSGGEFFGPMIYFGGGYKDVVRSMGSFALDYASKILSNRAHGANAAISIDPNEIILKELSHLADKAKSHPQYYYLTDYCVKDSVIGSGGVTEFTFKPDAIVFSKGDRYTTLFSLLYTYLKPGSRKKNYSDHLH